MHASSARCSLLVGLLMLMLASAPRYYLDGHDTHLIMLSFGGIAVAALAFFHWWQLASEWRANLKALIRRLAALMIGGIVIMGLWHALFGAWSGWPLLLSHGATLGLLLHALGLWWKPAT